MTSRMDFSPAKSATTRSSPKRDAPVRRRAVGKRVQEEPEAVAQLFLAEAQRPENSVLHFLLVNSNAARAQFHAVQHQVVAFRTHREAHFVGGVFEFRNVFLDDPREGMLRADHGFVRGAPFEERESR